MQIVPSYRYKKSVLWPSKYAKIRFRPELCPDPAGELTTLPQTPQLAGEGTPITTPHPTQHRPNFIARHTSPAEFQPDLRLCQHHVGTQTTRINTCKNLFVYYYLFAIKAHIIMTTCNSTKQAGQQGSIQTALIVAQKTKNNTNNTLCLCLCRSWGIGLRVILKPNMIVRTR